MAHSTNRTTDFAPAWLKLEQNQQQRRHQDPDQYHNSHQLSPHTQPPQSHQHKASGGQANSGSASTQHSNFHQKQLPTSSYQQYHGSNQYSNSHQHAHHLQNPPHHQHSVSNHQPHHRQASGGGRPQLNSYHSTYNGRALGGASSSAQQQTIHLQRSQSTGSYNDNVTRTAAVAPGPPVSSKPLEEEFPQLCGGASATGPTGSAQPSSQQVNNTAQWRIKERAQEDGSGNKSAKKSTHGSDNLLTSNMSGKVYRAQVKPVKRSSIIPITNGASAGGSSTSSITIKSKENGNGSIMCAGQGDDEDSNRGHSMLSSSLDKEKKFLQELGWKEDAESDEEGGIPEQDPEELEIIMMQAKAARQQLLLKSKQSMKTVPSAIIPNEDDIPSSSDNSDCE